jgi:hypothetical protein
VLRYRDLLEVESLFRAASVIRTHMPNLAGR